MKGSGGHSTPGLFHDSRSEQMPTRQFNSTEVDENVVDYDVSRAVTLSSLLSASLSYNNDGVPGVHNRY